MLSLLAQARAWEVGDLGAVLSSVAGSLGAFRQLISPLWASVSYSVVIVFYPNGVL